MLLTDVERYYSEQGSYTLTIAEKTSNTATVMQIANRNGNA